MRIIKSLALALILTCATQSVAAESIVKSQLTMNAEKVKAGEPIWAAITLAMPKDWHVYWKNPGDSGIATSFEWKLPEGVTAGETLWPKPRRVATGTIINYGYADRAIFLTPLTPDRDNITGEMSVKVSWLACKDTCIPESATFRAYLPQKDVTAAKVVNEARRYLTKPLSGAATYRVEDKKIVLEIASFEPFSALSQFIPLENGIIANDGAQEVTRTSGKLTIAMPRGNTSPIKEWHGILRSADNGFEVTATAQNMAPTATEQSPTASSSSLIVILLLALAGGLLLNLMPCVLPILSLKALALAKKGGGSNAEAKRQGIAYTAGVVGGFILIALVLLSLKSAGEAAGWGFQLQSPGFVVGLMLLMLLVSMNLLSWFELPVLLGSAASRISGATQSGSFCTGLLAVALATPCTAPFMATALGATLTLSATASLLVFAALGLGMALPFLVVSFWPAARKLLPKPGGWMKGFKQFLSVLVFLTAIWLVSVLTKLVDKQAAAFAIHGAIAIILLVRLHVARHSRNGRFFLFAILAVAFWTIAVQPSPRVPDKAQAMGAIVTELFNTERIDALRKEGTPVFVDATAAWCITCKINERVALRSDKVQAYFAEHGVVLMIADWTSGDDAITNYLASFGRNGVPLYVYYPPNGEPRVLPQLLTPSTVLDALADKPPQT